MIHAKYKNGEVKKQNLPTSYMIGRTNINIRTASVEIQQSEGFYEVVEKTPTIYQELLPLEPTDLINKKYVERLRNFTQQEIDDKVALDLVNQNIQEVETQLNNGRTLAVEIFVFVRKHTGLTNNQKAILKGLAISLYQGDIEQAIIDFNSITRPVSAGKMQTVYDILETKFNGL